VPPSRIRDIDHLPRAGCRGTQLRTCPRAAQLHHAFPRPVYVGRTTCLLTLAASPRPRPAPGRLALRSQAIRPCIGRPYSYEYSAIGHHTSRSSTHTAVHHTSYQVPVQPYSRTGVDLHCTAVVQLYAGTCSYIRYMYSRTDLDVLILCTTVPT
jgi:hypothetical protein